MAVYIKKRANKCYGLRKKAIEKLACNYAKANQKLRPTSWDEKELAEQEPMTAEIDCRPGNLNLLIKSRNKFQPL